MICKAESVYKSIMRGLWNDGEASFVANGRNFQLYYEGALSEVGVYENGEFLFDLTHESELEEWIEELYGEESVQPVYFLWCYTAFGEWVSKIASLAEIARTIGCRDFNETDNHRVYAVKCGIPVEILWAEDSRNLCIDFGEYGIYEYPDH